MDLSKMGGALEHWLGFQDKIGRAFMMNEDALKYPLSDYLVNDGGIQISRIALELPHPVFYNRYIDLTTIVNNNGQISVERAFELKLAKPETRNKPEKQRIFNDLMRLHLMQVPTTSYFIMVGKSTDFVTNFQKLNNEDNTKKFYENWFEFVVSKVKIFDVVNENNVEYSRIYAEFDKSYTPSCAKGKSFQLPVQITTTCEFITAFQPSLIPYMAGVWSVV